MTRDKAAARPLNERLGFALGSIGSVIAAISVCLYIIKPKTMLHFHVVVIGLWLVVPPAWFAVEAHYLVKDRTEEFKHNQELLARVWAGVSALLILLFTITFKT